MQTLTGEKDTDFHEILVVLRIPVRSFVSGITAASESLVASIITMNLEFFSLCG